MSQLLIGLAMESHAVPELLTEVAKENLPMSKPQPDILFSLQAFLADQSQIQAV